MAAAEGPYRDLGDGFARLTGAEGARRGPSPISCVEDALVELLRNARDAGAQNVFVATSLHRRRHRVLVVIDDGGGIPETHRDLVFEPGVTTRHLSPVLEPARPAASPGYPPEHSPRHSPRHAAHGAGLSLYHLKNAAESAAVAAASSPTAIKAVFDTTSLPERVLQSKARPSKTNLLATTQTFSRNAPSTSFFLGPPARILAALLHNRIIHNTANPTAGDLKDLAGGLGLDLSLRSVQRVLSGEIRPADRVPETTASPGVAGGGRAGGKEGPVLALGEGDRREIAAILGRAARGSYLEIGPLEVAPRPGEVSLTARVYEPEDEYD